MSLVNVRIDGIECGNLIDHANKSLVELCDDLVKRPRLEGARKLKITISLAPDTAQNARGAERQMVDVDWSIETSVPGHKGMTTRGFIQGDHVVINDADPLGDNPMQTNIMDVINYKKAM